MITEALHDTTATATSEAGTVPIPFFDMAFQTNAIRSELIAAVTEVLDSQHFILGPQVEMLEQEMAEYVDVRFATGCASGSDALLLALMAAGIGQGDEVITSPFTFGATAGSIRRLGARPVFVDIEQDTFNINPHQVERAVTKQTRAIMPVHLFGLAADMGPILEIAKRHSLIVIEDAAQAIGARWNDQSVGTIGNFGCFSFFPSKNLGAAGDGGMITTNDVEMTQKLRMLRTHGTRKKYHYELIGLNSRLDALQAAILRVKLRHLDAWAGARRQNAQRYNDLFREYGLLDRITLPVTPANRVHVFNQYSIRTAQRDPLKRYLAAHNIGTEVYYPSPLHCEPAFASEEAPAGSLPESEAAAAEVLALPIYPGLTLEQQHRIVGSIARFYAAPAFRERGALDL